MTYVWSTGNLRALQVFHNINLKSAQQGNEKQIITLEITSRNRKRTLRIKEQTLVQEILETVMKKKKKWEWADYFIRRSNDNSGKGKKRRAWQMGRGEDEIIKLTTANCDARKALDYNPLSYSGMITTDNNTGKWSRTTHIRERNKRDRAGWGCSKIFRQAHVLSLIPLISPLTPHHDPASPPGSYHLI